MEERVGRIVEELPALRRSLRSALGIGTGSCGGSGVAGGSWRGRVVVPRPAVAEEVDCEHALIVTEPRYSLRERYQIVVPLLDPDLFEPHKLDVPLSVGTVGPRIAAVNMVQSVFHHRDIRRATEVAVDELALRRIDVALLKLFDMTAPPPSG